MNLSRAIGITLTFSWLVAATILVTLALSPLGPSTRADGQVAKPDVTSPEKRRVGIVIDKLTNVPRTMIGPVPFKTVTYCMLNGGATNQIVTFRPIGGGQPQADVSVPAGATVGINFNARVPIEGFEVLTKAPAGDVAVSCNYFSSPGP